MIWKLWPKTYYFITAYALRRVEGQTNAHHFNAIFSSKTDTSGCVNTFYNFQWLWNVYCHVMSCCLQTQMNQPKNANQWGDKNLFYNTHTYFTYKKVISSTFVQCTRSQLISVNKRVSTNISKISMPVGNIDCLTLQATGKS